MNVEHNEIEHSSEYHLARLQMKIELLQKEIDQMKLEHQKLLHFKTKFESLSTLVLKVREAKETLYVIQEMIETAQHKINSTIINQSI